MNALQENFAMMEAYINGESDGEELLENFIWNSVLTVATLGLSFGLEKAMTRAAESYLTKIVGSRLAQGLLSEKVTPVDLVNAVRQLKSL